MPSYRDPKESWLKAIPLFWPVIVTAVGLTVTAASAGTRLNDLTAKVEYIWTQGPPVVAIRLARIEERQEQMAKTLERVDHKLDVLSDKQQTDRDGRFGRNK